MTTSTLGIWLIIAVTAVALTIFLGSVVLAASHPRRRHAHGEALRGTVQGGMHVGAGRSVAPRRDEPVTPGEVPAGDSLHPDGETPAASAESASSKPVSGSPMDL